MATTRIMSLHIGKVRTVGKAISDIKPRSHPFAVIFPAAPIHHQIALAGSQHFAGIILGQIILEYPNGAARTEYKSETVRQWRAVSFEGRDCQWPPPALCLCTLANIIGPAPSPGLGKVLPLGKQKLRVRDPAVALVAGDQPAAVRLYQSFKLTGGYKRELRPSEDVDIRLMGEAMVERCNE